MSTAAARGTLSGGAYFARRYRVVRALAAGGMGAVYEVFDEATRSPRALKAMLPSVVESPEHRMRFEREAQLTGAIESEHLVRITDAGIDGDVPFLVMELLRGEDLRTLLRRRGRLPPELVVPYLRQVALALDKTHTAGIIHRDLKPANHFLTQRDDGSPCMKVLDFGIAKLTTASSAIETGTVGTPLYMAPEQARGDRGITHLADLLALAHVAYAMLVGEAYFQEDLEQSDSIVGVFLAVAEGAREPPCARAWRRKGVRLPGAFDAWFLQAAAVRPESRFQNARAEVEALALALQGSSAAGQVKTVPMASIAQLSTAPSMPRRPTFPSAWLWGAGLIGVMAVVSLVGFVGWVGFAAGRATTDSDEEVGKRPAKRRRARSASPLAPSVPPTPEGRPGASGCYFERCRPVAIPPDGRIDPVAWLDEAEELAHSVLPGARLAFMKADEARAGAAELGDGTGSVSFLFETDTHSVFILNYGDQLAAGKPEATEWRRGQPGPRAEPSPCSLARVWEESRKLGLENDETVAVRYKAYANRPPLWFVDRSGSQDIELHGTKCARLE